MVKTFTRYFKINTYNYWQHDSKFSIHYNSRQIVFHTNTKTVQWVSAQYINQIILMSSGSSIKAFGEFVDEFSFCGNLRLIVKRAYFGSFVISGFVIKGYAKTYVLLYLEPAKVRKYLNFFKVAESRE